MLEAFDPSASAPARPFVITLGLSEAAEARLESGQNVRAFLDRLLGEGLTADALLVIARALPVQLLVAWGCECLRGELAGMGAAIEADRAAVTLAEQCLKDPSEEHRQLCLEFAERAKRATAGAWIATAAAWADGVLTPPNSPSTVAAPPQAVAEAVVAALKISATRAGGEAPARLAAHAMRALTLFAARPRRRT
jgi:uncharacterized protein DUF6931